MSRLKWSFEILKFLRCLFTFLEISSIFVYIFVVQKMAGKFKFQILNFAGGYYFLKNYFCFPNLALNRKQLLFSNLALNWGQLIINQCLSVNSFVKQACVFFGVCTSPIIRLSYSTWCLGFLLESQVFLSSRGHILGHHWKMCALWLLLTIWFRMGYCYLSVSKCKRRVLCVVTAFCWMMLYVFITLVS